VSIRSVSVLSNPFQEAGILVVPRLTPNAANSKSIRRGLPFVPIGDSALGILSTPGVGRPSAAPLHVTQHRLTCRIVERQAPGTDRPRGQAHERGNRL
jgi:hypothetical protein